MSDYVSERAEPAAVTDLLEYEYQVIENDIIKYIC